MSGFRGITNLSCLVDALARHTHTLKYPHPGLGRLHIGAISLALKVDVCNQLHCWEQHVMEPYSMAAGGAWRPQTNIGCSQCLPHIPEAQTLDVTPFILDT